VLLADGSRKAIEDVEVGDVVVTTDTETGETVTKRVTETITTEDDKDFTEITVLTEGGYSSIVATDTHPFWVPELREWVPAGDLRLGQTLRTSVGTHVQITALSYHTKRQRTHDLTIQDVHAYYVLAGATSVLVHNCGMFTSGGRKWVNGYGGDSRLQGIEASLDRDGILETVVRAPGGASGLPRGSQMLADAIKAWRGSGRKVNGIRGVWNEGELDANLQSLNAAVQMGLTPQQAVWHTFTGKFARSNGFTRATIESDFVAGTPGNYTEFIVTFS
jgi:hypothetical protein